MEKTLYQLTSPNMLCMPKKCPNLKNSESWPRCRYSHEAVFIVCLYELTYKLFIQNAKIVSQKS